MTREDKTFIVDCDIHQFMSSPSVLFPYLSRAYQEDIKMWGLRLGGIGGGGYANGGDRGYRHDSWPEDGGRPASSAEVVAKEHLDVYGIDYGILLGQELRAISTLPDADYAAALARAYNDWMIEEWLDKEERLKGAAYIAMQDPLQAAKEIRRVASQPGIIATHTINGTRFPYGQRYYDPIYEACVENDLVFMIHTGGEGTWGPPSPAGYPSYYIENRQTRQMGYMAHITSMVFEGLFERFPTLKVVFVEGGYVWLPTLLWRLDADWKGLRSHTPWVKKLPSEYVFEHIKFTSQPMEMPEPQRRLLTIFEYARAEQTLMFASDFPHWDFDSPEMALPRLPDPMHRRVFGETAAELFKLPMPKQAELLASDD